MLKYEPDQDAPSHTDGGANSPPLIAPLLDGACLTLKKITINREE